MITAHCLLMIASSIGFADEQFHYNDEIRTDVPGHKNIRHTTIINAVSTKGHCKNIEGTWTCKDKNDDDEFKTVVKFNFHKDDVDVD